MKEFFFFLLDNVFYIFFALFIILIFTLFSNNKKENKKFKNGVIEVLDKKAIIKSLNVYKSLGIVSIVSLMFIPVGILIFYLAFSQTNSVGNIILLVIFGFILIGVPLFIIYLLVKDGLLIRMGKYVIVEDTLLDVEVVYSNSDTGRSMDGYYFYFKDYFKKYNEVVKVGQNNFYNSKENDEFYLVFINGNKSPYVFSKRRYLLSDDDREKLVSIESLKDYVKKLQEFSYKKSDQSLIEITKEKIKRDFFDKSQKNTVLIDILIILFLIGMLVFCFMVDMLAFFIVLGMLVLFIFLAYVKIGYLYGVIKKIKNDKYRIEKDVVIALNQNVDFRNSNEIMSFRFENYKKLVYDSKMKYHDTQVGDEFYLVFVKGEKEPIKIYDVKRHYIK